MRTPSARDIAIVFLHALVLWALCGATIGIGRALVGIEATLIVHALAVPVFASLIAFFYFKKFGHFEPLVTAAIFTGLVISLDAGLVAPVFEKSFDMFRSILGTWIPFGLIFVSTLVTGVLSKKRRSAHRVAAPGPAAFWALLCLLVFQGISATPPGLLLILDPTGGLMKMPLSMLHGSPFHDFLIPGLILSIVLGLGALLVAAGLFFLPVWSWAERLNPFKRMHWSWMAAVSFGVALMVWIVVQVAMIGGGSWLQPLYFGVGLAILVLSLVPSVRSHLVAPSQQPSNPPDPGGAR